MQRRWTISGIEYDDDPRRVDRDAVWAFLSTEAYWARWRDRATVETQLDGAWRLVGAYDAETGRMVGLARAVSDGAHVAASSRCTCTCACVPSASRSRTRTNPFAP